MAFDYIKAASEIFGSTRYRPTKKDIKILASHMQKLNERGMGKLNARLLDGGRKIRDTFSELNFALKLISLHPDGIPISYEPDEGLRRPIDFKITLGEVTYWIQMKRLSTLERENRQNRIVDAIKREARSIKVDMFFDCHLSEDFSESDISGLISFLAIKALIPKVGKRHEFTSDGKIKTRVYFWHPSSSDLSGLTLGMSGDMGVVEETGHATNQIRQSITNAVGAFEWETGSGIVNLVAMDANEYDDIDLCDAVFGTEYETGRHTWGRMRDGIFHLPEISKNVDGLIALRSVGLSPVADYSTRLYVNPPSKDRIDDITQVVALDGVTYFDMRPPIGQGNFESSVH